MAKKKSTATAKVSVNTTKAPFRPRRASGGLMTARYLAELDKTNINNGNKK